MKSSTKNSNMRKAVSIVLALLMSLFLTLTLVLSVTGITILNKNFLYYEISNTAYAPLIVRDLDDSFVSYGIAGGFSEKFFTSVLGSARVNDDLHSEVERIYTGKESSIDSQGFRQYLFGKMIEDAKSRGITATENDKKYVDELARLCAQSYDQILRFPIPSSISSILIKAKIPIIAGICLFAALTVTCGLFIKKINAWRRRVLRYYMYSVGGSFLMIAVPSMIVFLSDKISKIGIARRSLYYLVVDYLSNIIFAFLICAVILLVLWIVLLFVRLHIINSKKENSASAIEEQYQRRFQ